MTSKRYTDFTGPVIAADWLNDVNDGTYNRAATSGGSANAVVLGFTPTLQTLQPGQIIRFVAANSNTGPATIQIDGQGPYPLRGQAGTALKGGEITSGLEHQAQFNGTVFSLLYGSGAVQLPANTYLAGQTQSLAQQIAAAAGGGAAPSLAHLTDFTMTGTGPSVDPSVTPNRSYQFFSDTTPAGWNTGTGKMTVDFQFTSSNYFSLNPTGHFAVIARQDPSTWLTVFRGGGVAIGNTSQIAEMPPQYPTAVLESWVWGDGPSGRLNWLYPNSVSPPGKTLADGVLYRCIIDTTVVEYGRRYLRYRLYQWVATGASNWDNQWKLINDTGDTLDSSDAYSDWTKAGLGFIETFSSTRTGWSIAFTNIFVIWGPYGSVSSDATDRLHTAGGILTGDVRVQGTKRLIRLAYNDSTPATATTFTANEDNSPASVFVAPSGTAQFASLTAANSSSTTAMGLFSMQAAAAEHTIVSYSAGGYANCNISVSVQGVKIATFSTTTLTVNGGVTVTGTKPLIRLPYGDSTPSTVATFTSYEANSPATIFVAPSGTGNFASVTAANSSSTTAMGLFSLQAGAAEHNLVSYSGGGYANCNISITIQGVKVGTFSTSSFAVLQAFSVAGASTFTGAITANSTVTVSGNLRATNNIYLNSSSTPLGQTETAFNAANLAGSNIMSLMSANYLDFDGWMGSGVISNYYNTAGDKGVALENIFKIFMPRLAYLMYCMQQRKVI